MNDWGFYAFGAGESCVRLGARHPSFPGDGDGDGDVSLGQAVAAAACGRLTCSD